MFDQLGILLGNLIWQFLAFVALVLLVILLWRYAYGFIVKMLLYMVQKVRGIH